jgi:hypothetical protein
VARGDIRGNKTLVAWALLAQPQIYNLDARELIIMKNIK